MLLDAYSDTKKRIHDFLQISPIGVLSTVTPSNDPHGAVVYYGIDHRFVVTILTKSGTRKYDNLSHNSHTMLTVFEPLTQTTVQLTGIAKEVTDPHRINEIAQQNIKASMDTSEGGIPAITKLEAGDYVAFEIHPVLVRMAVYERPDSGDYNELFETISNFELKEF
jgi:general stress protein 26